MSYPKIEELRGRVMGRMSEVRSRARSGGFMGQGLSRQGMKLGGGQLVSQARQRANMASRRLSERKPGMIPMVKEFKPGQRLRQFFPEITDYKDMAVEAYPAYPSNGRDMAVFVE